MKSRSSQTGFSLVEMIVYITILSIVVSAVTVAASSLLTTFTHLKASQDIAETGMVALERMTREIRFANTVSPASVLGTSTGSLVLETEDAGGTPTTLTFSLENERIMLTEHGVSAPLTRGAVRITELTFTRIIGVRGDGIRITCAIETTVRGLFLRKEFRTFVLLRE